MSEQRSWVVRDEAMRQRVVRAIQSAELRRGDFPAPLLVTVERYRKRRSLAQNRLAWMWLGIISDHIEATLGKRYSDEELHEWFKRKFLKAKLVKLSNGPGFRIRKSTATLSTVEMSEYLDKIDRYANDALNLILPHPEDLYEDAMQSARKAA